ncbi:DUF4345 domain-containing protein [Kribbella albertanoniae]|uniref:DUF4345 domain-containing protein n=1 Tax=Kribbella albertanoniae TaxID=1266829 RepID=A0A4R4PNN6_9ACTN|nr:DUF4345 domain-containing protein [Kribbella albertanoniae]
MDPPSPSRTRTRSEAATAPSAGSSTVRRTHTTPPTEPAAGQQPQPVEIREPSPYCTVWYFHSTAPGTELALDSQLRYLSFLMLGTGLVLLWSVPRIERATAPTSVDGGTTKTG